MPNSSKHAKKPTYLHGDLSLHIIEARHLPNMDIFSEHFRRCIPCSKDTNDDVLEGARKDKKDRPHMKITINDPYVTVLVSQVTVARTHVVKNAQNPFWDEKFEICLAHPVVEHLEFQVKDNDVFGAEIIGSVRIPVEDIVSGVRISGWFSILGSSGKPTKEGSALRVDIRFVPFEMNSVYRDGIAGDPGHNGVKDAYFPVRKGSGVRLYQDAHVPEGLLPDIELDGGKFFSHGKCWEDICYAISEAHHLIYIVGWSVFHKIKLVREPTRPLPRGGDLTLGELLKYKSQEGVRVLLLVWDDKTSHDKLFIETAGVMQTHDEEISKSVTCVLSPRYASNKHSFIRQQVIGSVFTHHQKCLLVDTQAPGNNRKITAFIGGLDLCDGRYDTPEHRLFRDLDTVYKDDYHQPTYPAGTMAPREPWHDLHCRIDGPAAYDILINFEQRWKKASKWKEFTLRVKKVSHTQDDALIKVERISWILSPPLSTSRDGVTDVPKDDPEVWVCSEEDPENWHVQIFRSIDSGSVKGFPRYVHEAETMNLNTDKDLVIERSIQTAYVQAIRSAQHFIYIENQYFIGSSYAWPSYKNAGADNLIPMELALKIASKIRARERFSVYIVVPMWPEGNPKDATVQEILYWQGQTMQMMYHVIANELNTMHIDDVSPQDYLNFYCLGNREDIQIKTAKEGNQVDGNSSKMFQQVDDEYVILGSANINQRSMAGTKDTEIAMGAYQPHHTWARKNRHPRGQIYGYRNSLWAEHLGKLENFFEEPNTLECVRRVNEIAKDNWKRFTADEFSLLQGHLLKYPVHVGEDGEVSPLPGHEEFPDLGGKVLGAYSTAIPDVLTT